MKKTLQIIAGILVLGLFVWTLVYLYQKNQEKPVVFETIEAEYRDIIKKSVATGSVVPRKEILIKPQISGILEELYVKPGQIVGQGDLIAKVKIIPDMVALNSAENRVNQAKIALENARADYDRNKQLLDKNVIAAAEFQPFEIARRQAQEELSAAEDNLAIIREGVSRKSGNASNTLIRSTAPGMVLDVPVEVGFSVIEANNFNEGTTIASVADMEKIIFKGKIDESEVEKLEIGMELILTIGAIDEEKFKAVLEYISPKGVEENGAIQFEIEAAVQLDSNQFIRAGYSANADVVLDKKENVFTIPEAVILYDGEQPYVEVETKTQVFERRDIKTGLSDGIYIEVTEGLGEGDQIKKQV